MNNSIIKHNFLVSKIIIFLVNIPLLSLSLSLSQHGLNLLVSAPPAGRVREGPGGRHQLHCLRPARGAEGAGADLHLLTALGVHRPLQLPLQVEDLLASIGQLLLSQRHQVGTGGVLTPLSLIHKLSDREGGRK